MKFESKKYKDLKPKIAKILEVYSIKGSLDIAKIAGIESTAKITSVNSITATTTKRGVAILTPFLIVKKFPPSYVLLIL